MSTANDDRRHTCRFISFVATTATSCMLIRYRRHDSRRHHCFNFRTSNQSLQHPYTGPLTNLAQIVRW